MDARKAGTAVALLLLLFTASGTARAQSTDAKKSGWWLFEQLRGSSDSYGQITRWDSDLGYDFGPHFGIDAGVPVYFLHLSVPGTTGTSISKTGLGDAYLDLRFTFDNPVLNYRTTLTGAAPTGDTSAGLSTGRATVLWMNHVDRAFGPLRPFADAGIANAATDTSQYQRPFISYGFVGLFDGGAELSLRRWLGVGASGYAVEPGGQQKVYSRLFNNGPLGGLTGLGHIPIFRLSQETTGPANIARDDGVSTWVDLRPASTVYFEIGYTRSVQFDINELTWGVGFNLGRLVREAASAFR